MLKIPNDLEDRELLELLNSLERFNQGHDGQRIRKWLESENDRIAKLNRTEKDNTLNRWNQGAGQLLDDLFKIMNTARQKSDKILETIKNNTEV